MDVGVAVRATAGQDHRPAGPGARPGDRRGRAAVAGRLVALLAQVGQAHAQQARVGAAMRVVADRAVLLHRRVVAHERPALLHVAGVTGVADRVAHHHRWPDRAVRVVAVGAGDLALTDRVARGPVDVGALILVAGEAHGHLGDLVADRVLCGVDLVACRARGVLGCVHAALPVDAPPALVAGEAHLVLRVRGSLPSEPLRDRVLGGTLQVLGRIAVAGLAVTTGPERCACVCPYGVPGTRETLPGLLVALHHDRERLIRWLVAGWLVARRLFGRLCRRLLGRLCEGRDGQDGHRAGA